MGVQTALAPQDNRGLATRTEDASSSWPEIPAAIGRLIRAGVISSHMVFPENGPAREIVRWKAPIVRDAAELERVELHLDAVEAHLEPMERGELLARVLALLSHFRVDPQPDQVEMMMADDWAEDLGDYPAWAVESAARRWRRTRKFKPQICEMRALCESECGDKRVHRDRLRAIVDVSRREASPQGRNVAGLASGLLGRVPGESWD